jgi:hypothetical protein
MAGDGIGPGANQNLLVLSRPFWACLVGSNSGVEVIYWFLGLVGVLK